MREIKFRAHCEDTGVLFDWDALQKIDLWWKRSGFKLMQFTGLKDKNGKEIYEGDILKELGKVEWGKYSDGEYVNEVECWIASAVPISDAHDRTYGHESYELEVIGNIYENGELLERTEK